MLSYFRPPTFGDPDRDERARVLFFSVLMITIGCVAAAILGVRDLPAIFDLRQTPLAYTVTPLALVCLAMNRRGHTSAAAWLFLAVFIALNWARATTLGDIYSPAVSMLVVMTLFACVTLGPRAGVAVAITCIGINLALALNTPRETATALNMPLGSAWVPPCLAIVCTLFLAYISVNRTAKALRETRAELAVRQAAERKLSLALQTGAIGTYEGDLHGDTIIVDEQMLKILGTTTSAGPRLSRKDGLALVHPDDAPILSGAVDSLRRGAPSFRVELRLAPPNQERYIEIASTVIVEASGVHSQIGTVTDLSERRLAEAERRKLEAELRSAEQMRGIGVMARGIAHDFNNILGAIQGFSSLLEDDLPKDSPERGFAVRITDATNRGQSVVGQILALAKLENQPRSVVNIPELIEDLTPLLESLVSPTVVLEVEAIPSRLWCDVNEGLFTQVLSNLCKNASDAFTGRPGRVSIKAKRLTAASRASFSRDLQRGRAQMTGELDPHSDYALITVADNGPGIALENLHRVFEPFYTTKTAGRGTGLGLSVVQSAAESLGGVCVAQTAPGVGSRFSVILPLSPPPRRKAG
jgi:signal transduction histidine kinase